MTSIFNTLITLANLRCGISKKFEDHVIYFRLELSNIFVLEVVGSIVIDTNLRAKLFMKVPIFHSQRGLDKDIFVCLKMILILEH